MSTDDAPPSAERSNSSRKFIASAGCAVLLAWGTSQFMSAVALRRWADADIATRLAIPEGNLSSQQLTDRAAARMEAVFPPDWKGAEQDATAAVRRDPFRSQNWMVLARAQIFSGSPEAARQSISRADELDPWYPLQRLHSAQLWSLLGEDARAEDLAKSVAAMGKNNREQAAAELVKLGLGAQRVFDVVRSKDDTPNEVADLLAQLPATEPAALHAIYVSLPAEWKTDPEFRGALFTRASNPFDYEVIRDLLIADGRDVVESGTVAIIDGTLLTPPFASGLRAGWMPAPAKLSAQVAWLTPQVTPTGNHGLVRLSFGRPRAGGAPAARYPFYRFPAKKGPGVIVTLTLRSPNARVVQTMIDSRRGTVVSRSERVDVSSDPTDVTLTISNIVEDGFQEINIDVRAQSDGEGDASLLLGPLRIEPLQAAVAP
ncbi:hypothetical protein BH09SUM1_BH09SUM1_05520 [soil metagenome]